MGNDLSFFSTQGTMSDPGEFAGMFHNLPTGIADLVRVVQGCMIHVFWAERYGLVLSDERKGEVQLRTTRRRLAKMRELDPRPLTEPRALENKTVGNCRDHSVLLAAILRHQGVPARARCGFGVYFMPNHYEDHWVCEYWNAEQSRWMLVDAQLDDLQKKVLGISFDTLDVPRDQFIVGGLAWQMCRSGQADPESFGIFDMRGLGFVRGDFIRDVAALNKVELLPWDCWGIIEQESIDEPGDVIMLDHLAGLTSGDVPDFAVVRALYQGDSRLRVDGKVHSYVDGGMVTIEL